VSELTNSLRSGWYSPGGWPNRAPIRQMWEIVPVGEFSAHQPWLSADAGDIFTDIGVLTKRPRIALGQYISPSAMLLEGEIVRFWAVDPAYLIYVAESGDRRAARRCPVRTIVG